METQNNASKVQAYLATKAKELEYQKQNMRILFAALEGAGVKEATYEYVGYGDSGDMEDTAFYGADGKVIKSSEITSLIVEVFEWNYSDSDAKTVSWPLWRALDSFCHFVIKEAGHSGYETNEGGGGLITFYVPHGEFKLEHYYNVVERVESSILSYDLFDE